MAIDDTLPTLDKYATLMIPERIPINFQPASKAGEIPGKLFYGGWTYVLNSKNQKSNKILGCIKKNHKTKIPELIEIEIWDLRY